ncbi:hypothetical protein CAEBREN_22297 [Caenorhabditis brenneri]|uniref:NTF2-like domain-containing protein n=1 Tax=Caenorhabditis brenneri TaxID=135651 RepID=G0MMK6_CAEBE|nr:hypothetical protein CAEBREN_22297 [Caenorhabditis brenneri]
MRANDVVNVERDKKKWAILSDDAIRSKKDEFARKLLNRLVEASSEEHAYYKESFEWIESLLEVNLQAEVCGSPDTMNMMQYTKFMEKAATQYVNVSETTLKQYALRDAPKDMMKVYMIFMQEDKNGVKTFMNYDVELTLTFARPLLDMPFSIIKITQGVKCEPLRGVTFNTVDRLGDIVEDLATHPTAQSFFKLFTPRTFEYTEESKFEDPYVHNLPVLWLNHFERGSFVVCADAEGVFTGCAEKTFYEWYEKFGMMWHPVKADGHPMTMNVTELKGKSLHVDITMPLQIGTNESAKIHNWSLKIAAELMPSGRWMVGAAGFVPPVHKSFESLMDENYLAYQEVLGNVFLHYINDKKNWYTATDFVKHFKKYGETVRAWNCNDEIKDREEFPKSFLVKHKLWNATIVGFHIKKPLALPADEDTTVELRVVFRPTEKLPKHYVLGSDWKFWIRWDTKIQFYYIYQAEFGCPGVMSQETGEWGTFRSLASIRRKSAEHPSHE